MFKKSDNISKLKELVSELNIRDIEVFETKELLEIIIENATDGYWDWMIEDDYEFLSIGFKSQLGYSDDEMENHPSSWQKLIYEEDLDIMFSEVEKHFNSNGEYPFKVISRYKHKDGHEVKVLCKGKVVQWSKDGKPIRMVGTHIDITDIINF